MSTDFPALRERPRPGEPDTIANFPRRLDRVIRSVGLPDQRTELFPMKPGGVWSVGVRVISPAFAGLGENERVGPLWNAVLDHLWDEQSRVGGLFAYTPEEYGGPAAGDD